MKTKLSNDVLFIEFLREEAGNSFGTEEARELLKIISAHKKSAKALIWTSAHSSLFCAGGDLKTHGQFKSKKQGLEHSKLIRKALSALAKWPVPKVAFVNGDCFGGGMELLSCFDYRISSSHVLFGFWQRRVTLSFGWGGFERWSNKLSPDVIKSLGFSARVFGSHEALRLGVIHQIGKMHDVERWVASTLKWTAESGVALSELDTKNETRTFEKLWWNSRHQEVLKKFNG